MFREFVHQNQGKIVFICSPNRQAKYRIQLVKINSSLKQEKHKNIMIVLKIWDKNWGWFFDNQIFDWKHGNDLFIYM